MCAVVGYECCEIRGGRKEKGKTDSRPSFLYPPEVKLLPIRSHKRRSQKDK
jgi:hypothetical protein